MNDADAAAGGFDFDRDGQIPDSVQDCLAGRLVRIQPPPEAVMARSPPQNLFWRFPVGIQLPKHVLVIAGDGVDVGLVQEL